jgi:hypothetical protein
MLKKGVSADADYDADERSETSARVSENILLT